MIDNRTAPWAALVLRVTLGIMFIAHALLKYAVCWVSAALIPILLGAAWAHAGNGWVFTAPNGGWEYPASLAAAAAVQALLGDGKYALTTLFPIRKLQGGMA